MQNYSRCREKIEGWLGRRRTYRCQECGDKFQVDTKEPLPIIERVCCDCRKHTAIYIFIDKTKNKEYSIRAAGVELAALRAWEINPKLTFKITDKEFANVSV